MAPIFKDDESLFNFVVKDGNGVKGLVDLGLTEIPGRYIHPPHRRIKKQEFVGSFESVTIDLSELDGPNHEHIVKAIVHASETQGFFQVVNHGVPLEVLESLKTSAHLFFSQPAIKKVVYLDEGSNFSTHIDTRVKYGTSLFPATEKTMDWRDYLNLMYINEADAREYWPDDVKELVLEFIKTSSETVQKLLQALIRNLGVKLDDSRFQELIGYNLVDLNLYPACPNPDLTTGVRRHTDIGMLSVLLQDDIGGLYANIGDQNASPGNEVWVEIPPIHGALVINIGDTLQILSNGRYKSPEHMVRTTDTESRLSVLRFISPLFSAKVGPFPEVVARDGVARYKEVIFGDYYKNLFGKSDDEKSTDFALAK